MAVGAKAVCTQFADRMRRLSAYFNDLRFEHKPSVGKPLDGTAPLAGKIAGDNDRLSDTEIIYSLRHSTAQQKRKRGRVTAGYHRQLSANEFFDIRGISGKFGKVLFRRDNGTIAGKIDTNAVKTKIFKFALDVKRRFDKPVALKYPLPQIP